MSMPLVHWLLALGLQAPTYHEDIRPILEQKCGSCHQPEGLAGFGFSSYETASDMHQTIAESVRTGRMPPWMPDENCRPLQRSRALTNNERELILQWSDANAPAGEEPAAASDTAPVMDKPALQEPILILQSSSSYLPNAADTDDYRCFVMPHAFDENTYVTGYDFRPGQNQLVHHAALFLALPAWFDALAELESDAGEQPGYPCFGGPGIDYVEYLGGWVPGSGAVLFPTDSAFVVPAGAKLIMQVHYNLSGGFTAPDKTQVSLSVVEDAPKMRLKQRPMVNLDFVIPPGESRSVHIDRTAHEGENEWLAVGVLPHMHLRGREIRLEIVHPDESKTCLVDIPDWDFEWQETYFFRDPLPVQPGDELELTCIFDNSDGTNEAEAVRWGEGTNDEMCVVVLTTLAPMDATPQGTCVVAGDQGNELGVGRFCTDLGNECAAQEANFCLASAVEDMPFCTKIFCGSDDECGSGATCRGGPGGSACIPLSCQGDEEGCSCESGSATSPQLLPLFAFFLWCTWLWYRPRSKQFR